MPFRARHRLVAAVNIGSYRTSAIIAEVDKDGAVHVRGSGHCASAGVRRGYVVDIKAAGSSVRGALHGAEAEAGCSAPPLWVGFGGAGLAGATIRAQVAIGGRRIDPDDLELLEYQAVEARHRTGVVPAGCEVLHAEPMVYTVDGAHGVIDALELHADVLAADYYLTLGHSAPMRNLRDAVAREHFRVLGVVPAPHAAAAACLTREEREVGVALVDFGAELTSVSVYAAGRMIGLQVLESGSHDITQAIAARLGISDTAAERLKCKYGSATDSPEDRIERIDVGLPEDTVGGVGAARLARGADADNRILRVDLIDLVLQRLGQHMATIKRALDGMGYPRHPDRMVVFCGGGALLDGLPAFAEAALGRSVRIGEPPPLVGHKPAHAGANSVGMMGLALLAGSGAADGLRPAWRMAPPGGPAWRAMPVQLWRAMREAF